MGLWDVSKMMNMSLLFNLARSFIKDIGSCDVSSVTEMPGMLISTDSFNQDIYIHNWQFKTETNAFFY